ncbi:ABC transporter ATP-binding protein [Brevibacillus sp. SYP-B805]|uniref:ABC transporter ATP-binding protein n=1 Tax=Brevibacillus sp. SYP-B805 TaxID=1578199 RepID=UPI0013ECDB47|nr:ABC transporter ATP-binding protein [Brevibacillus sp. SYP-B805]NGQ97521.1 ABC transporter ATP-binding protein [Brevibacillus sp. SYP-B805]
MSILEVKEVTKLYKNGRGVRNVSFDISKGDIFGLIGPNGAGKTTLLKLIMGLIRPDQGSIRIFGHCVSERFEQAMEIVGCIIETADAYDYMSAYDNLKLSARFYPDLPKTRIDQSLEQVGLAPYKRERVGGFSLGMKQRLALASALLSNPQLVILDEPTNGLDMEGMVDVRNTIQQLALEQGITFLISSHLIHDLSMIANRIGIMHNGSLIRLGKVNEWLTEEMTLEQYVISQIQALKEEEDYGSFIRQYAE